MWNRVLAYFGMAGRVMLEVGLCLIGVLDVRPLLAGRTSKQRIALQAYAPHLAQFYVPLLENLAQEIEDVELVLMLLPHPHFSLAEQRSLRRFAESAAAVYGAEVKSYWRCLWHRFDILLCVDVYAWFPCRKTLKVLLMHGPGLTRRNVDPAPFRKTVRDFDAVLVSGETDRALLKGFLDQYPAPTRVSAVGTPFFDDWPRAADSPAAYCARLGLDEGRRTLLVAPSWVGLRWFQELGCDWLAEVVQSLRGLDLNIVVKLHACSFNWHMAGGVAWKSRLESLKASSGAMIDFDIDDRPALAQADLLITDISSRAFNFMLLGKPVLLYWPFMDPRDPWDEERLAMLRHGSKVAATPDELRALLKGAWTGGGGRRIAQGYFSNPGSATSAVLAWLKAELQGSHPAS